MVPPGGLVHAPVLHAHQPVLHDVQQADAVGAAQLVELADDVAGLHLLAVHCHGHALLKVQGDVGGLVRGLHGGDAHLQEAGLVVLGLVGGVLQVQALVGQVPEVLILGVVGLPADLQGDVVGLGVVDLLVPAFDVPLRQGAMIFMVGANRLMASSNRTWSLPLPVQPWAMASAPSALAISTRRLAMMGRAKAVPRR